MAPDPKATDNLRAGKRVQIHLPQSDADALIEEAQREERSLSSMVVRLVREALTARHKRREAHPDEL